MSYTHQPMQVNSADRNQLKTYVIEREIPGIGGSTIEELENAAQTSCITLNDLGADIQWIQSYVTGDKIYCIYQAGSEEMIKLHADRAGFPANSISEVSGIMSRVN